MDIKKIRADIQDKFGSDERAAEIIAGIFDNELDIEDILTEEKFYFSIDNDNVDIILEMFNIKDYAIEKHNGTDALVMFNVRDAAAVYYTFLHVDELITCKEKICSWCKKPIGIFKDLLSEKEYKINGQCQDCQDKNWK